MNETTDAIVFRSGDCTDDQALGRPGRELAYSEILAAVAQKSATPHYLLTTRQGVLHKDRWPFSGMPVFLHLRLNPIKVRPAGKECVIVDALIIPE